MGKTWNKQAKNDSWRKAKQQKFNKKHKGNKPPAYNLYDRNFGVLVEPETDPNWHA